MAQGPRWPVAEAQRNVKKAQRETLGERCREGEAGCFVP